MTTATLDNPTIEDIEITDCDFDLTDFFSEEATVAPTMQSLISEEMFSPSAGDEWPVVGEGASGVAPPNPPPTKTIYQQIWDIEHELGNACREEERLRSLVKSAKELRIDLTEQLEQLCNERDNPTPEPEPAAGQGDTAAMPTTGAVASGAASSPQAWGREPIEVLAKHGLKPAKVEALRAAAEAGKFGGDVAGLRDWIAKYDLWHRDVKGCGPKGADAISDALNAYIMANPMTEQPLTAEDEARHVAAAEWLGHTKPSEPLESSSPLPMPELLPDSTAIIGGSSDYAVESAPKITEPKTVVADEPALPLASNVKPAAAKRVRKPKTPTIKTTATAPSTDAGPAVVSTPQSPASSSPPQADEEEAYLKGCEAGASNASCSENPFADRSSPQAKEWHRGWEECSAAG